MVVFRLEPLRLDEDADFFRAGDLAALLFFDDVFRAEDLLLEEERVGDFLVLLFLTGAFLLDDLLADAFLLDDFLAGDFLAGDFLAGDFLVEDFFA